MQLRKLGRTGLDVSAISLGTEYLINQPCAAAASVIHAALDQGINFFDLFFAQPQFRDNMGVAFAGHRSQALLGAHLGAILRDDQEDLTRDPEVAESFFLDFLKRYRTDYVDIAFMHNCDPQEDYDKLMQPGGLCDLAERYRREGKTRFIGFSGHSVATALQAVESGRIDVLMFPINLASNAVPGKRDLFNACAAHNVGLVAMKPFAGGKLLQPMGTFAMEFWHTGGAGMQLEKRTPITPVQCLSYVLAQVGVSTTIPGCKDREQLAAALAYWDATEEERDFSSMVAGFNQYVTGECVYCNHCLPCPSRIDIGQTIRLFEMAQRELTPAVRDAYRALIPNAADCIACGDCEERCPFDVAVIEKMEQAQALFASAI